MPDASVPLRSLVLANRCATPLHKTVPRLRSLAVPSLNDCLPHRLMPKAQRVRRGDDPGRCFGLSVCSLSFLFRFRTAEAQFNCRRRAPMNTLEHLHSGRRSDIATLTLTHQHLLKLFEEMCRRWPATKYQYRHFRMHHQPIAETQVDSGWPKFL